MSSTYNLTPTRDETLVLDELRRLVAQVAGVTIVGNRLTIRFMMNGNLASIHSVITEITTPAESKESLRQYEARQKLIKEKYPDLEAELYFIEEGDWPK